MLKSWWKNSAAAAAAAFSISKIRPRPRLSEFKKFGRGRGFLDLKKSAAVAAARLGGRGSANFRKLSSRRWKIDKCNWASRMVTFRTQFKKFSHFWSKNHKKVHDIHWKLPAARGRQAARLQDLGRGRGFLNLKNSAAAAAFYIYKIRPRPRLSQSQKLGRGRATFQHYTSQYTEYRPVWVGTALY